MKKVKLTIEQAQNAMFRLLEKADSGDLVYEFAHEVFHGFISFLEDGAKVDDEEERLDSGEEWYDEIHDEFCKAAYDKLTAFLTQK